jgi:hypothetical protein
MFRLAIALALSAAITVSAESPVPQLLAGVSIVNATGAPGSVLVAGPEAFPVIVGKSGNAFIPVAAGCTYGRGRVIALGHESFLSPEALAQGDTARFIRNAVQWLGGKADPPLAVDKAYPLAAKGLASINIQASFIDPAHLSQLVKGTVYIVHPDSYTPQSMEPIRAFIRDGGAVLCSCVGWGWHQVSGGKSFVTESPFNLLLGPAGLYTDDHGAERTSPKGYITDKPLPSGLNATEAIALIGKGDVTSRPLASQIAATVTAVSEVLPPDEKPIRSALAALMAAPAANAVPLPGKPLGPSQLAARLSIMQWQKQWLADPVRVWPAHPAAAVYPGLPEPGSARATRELTVDLAVPRWHSTGLFAVAGEPLTVRLPDSAAALGLRLRIGQTTCRVTGHDTWHRAPVVDIEVPLDKASVTLSSPFGGMVYVIVPQPSQGVVKVSIGPACPAPWFKSGRDTLADWRGKARSLPAPWAELECGKIILTVPSKNIRQLDDPEALLALWSDVLDLDARLTGLPAARASAERYSSDIQVCAGYMHAGYPIMLPIPCTAHLVNAAEIKAGQVDDVWGFFHEMGHNHQNYDWTWDGTGEVTVNLFTLYCMDHICGLKPRQTKMGQPWVAGIVKKWEADGKSYDALKSDAYLYLEFYTRLIEKYGWGPIEKLFAEYRTLAPSGRPKSDLQKRQQFCARLSRITGDDVSVLFKEWNIPLE